MKHTSILQCLIAVVYGQHAGPVLSNNLHTEVNQPVAVSNIAQPSIANTESSVPSSVLFASISPGVSAASTNILSTAPLSQTTANSVISIQTANIDTSRFATQPSSIAVVSPTVVISTLALQTTLAAFTPISQLIQTQVLSTTTDLVPNTTTSTTPTDTVPTVTATATVTSEDYTFKYEQMRGAINVLADILMYVSFFVTVADCAYSFYAFKSTSEKILNSAFKSLMVILLLFGIFYRKNVLQTTGCIVFIVWLAGVLSLWHEFKVVHMIHLLSNIPLFNTHEFYLSIAVLIIHLCTAGAGYVYCFNFQNQNIQDYFTYNWFTYAFPIWIAFVVLLDNISMIYISGRIFTVTVQLNWYNDVFIQKTKKIYYISQALILMILFIDCVGIVCYSYSYAIEKVDAAFNSFDLIAMAFYCTPLHYILVWIFFNQTIELGYGYFLVNYRDINLTLSTAPSVLVFDRKEEPASFGVQGRYI
ncbi:hypothetical protein HDV06_000880 [Boothiomyces sp. JEL0866]|nr:hypothetical protein HDV06_000880 [Boothiomyces sp. JEL0866]